jgi:ubiquinone/menaquinone biosynthesis C-methylase UbiE
MNRDIETKREQECRRHHGGRGPSSFWMHDPDVVFGAIQLSSGETFLDMGCGPGDYAFKAAEIVGQSGRVIAVDASPEMIGHISERTAQENITNVECMIADITEPLAIKDSTVDVCFLSTVLHIFQLEQCGKSIFSEIRRVLKPEGRTVIIECKKERLPFGPPLEMRLSADELSAVATASGFIKKGDVDLGYNYLVLFKMDTNNL